VVRAENLGQEEHKKDTNHKQAYHIPNEPFFLICYDQENSDGKE
jgi:hypothetical protein